MSQQAVAVQVFKWSQPAVAVHPVADKKVVIVAKDGQAIVRVPDLGLGMSVAYQLSNRYSKLRIIANKEVSFLVVNKQYICNPVVPAHARGESFTISQMLQFRAQTIAARMLATRQSLPPEIGLPAVTRTNADPSAVIPLGVQDFQTGASSSSPSPPSPTATAASSDNTNSDKNQTEQVSLLKVTGQMEDLNATEVLIKTMMKDDQKKEVEEMKVAHKKQVEKLEIDLKRKLDDTLERHEVENKKFCEEIENDRKRLQADLAKKATVMEQMVKQFLKN